MLAAVTEVIRSQGGKETETEYFAALVSAFFLKKILLDVMVWFDQKAT